MTNNSGTQVWGSFTIEWDFDIQNQVIHLKLLLNGQKIAKTNLSLNRRSYTVDETIEADSVVGDLFITIYRNKIDSLCGEFDYEFNGRKFYFSGTIESWEDSFNEDEDEDWDEDDEDFAEFEEGYSLNFKSELDNLEIDFEPDFDLNEEDDEEEEDEEDD